MGVLNMSFRKLDYIIFYILIILFFVVQLITPTIKGIIAIFLISIIPSLILGTITNLIFKKRVSSHLLFKVK